MCYFITIGVPEKNAAQMSEAFGRGFQLFPTANVSVLSAFPPKYGARLLTSGLCSCDLYFQPQATVAANRDVHLRRKYARQGWSQAKIERAVAQSQGHKASSAPRWSGLRSDVVEGLRQLGAAAGAVAVVVHFYDGDLEDERLSLTRCLRCEWQDFPARAANLEEDAVLVGVCASAKMARSSKSSGRKSRVVVPFQSHPLRNRGPVSNR